MIKQFTLLLALLAFLQDASAQCEPQSLQCNSPVQACDYSINNPQYWNDLLWWDNNLLSHDLAEVGVDLSLAIRDTCPGGGILSVRCLLFLDLDGNGTQETVVDSDNPPASGMVHFNNAGNPNYTGGTPRLFDQRPVLDALKWRFELQTSTQGDTTHFRLSWVSDAAPAVYEMLELAYGNHRVQWIVTNAMGGQQICEKNISAKDCKAPTVVCLNGLSVNIMPTQLITLWSTDFLQYTEDNVTPTGLIKTGVRKAGTGVGFPLDPNGTPITSLSFSCEELGPQEVELWAQDLAGNSDYCQVTVLIQDNQGFCGDPPAFIKACANTDCEDGLEEMNYEFEVYHPFLPPTSFFDLDNCGSINQVLPPDSEVVITPSKDDNFTNGVSSYDMVLIKKHIDGIDLFDTPYQWIAADANNDQVIDTLDIVECKKLILGFYLELPNNRSWRFVDKSYVFPSPDPLSAPFPESITVNTSNLPSTDLEFIGVKICDLTCGNLVGFYDLEPEDQHLIGTPQPNPTVEGAMLPIQLVAAEHVLLEVSDISGRLLFQQEIRLPAGPAMLEIPASAMAQAGVYIWRVRAGEVTQAGKILRY